MKSTLKSAITGKESQRQDVASVKAVSVRGASVRSAISRVKLESTKAKSGIVDRKAYEDIGGAEACSAVKGGVVNRNAYEICGPIDGKEKPEVCMRNTYEICGPGGESTKPSAVKPAIGGGYVLFGKGGQSMGPSQAEAAASVLDEKSAASCDLKRKERRERRLKRLAEAAKRWSPMKKTVVFGSVAVVAVLLLAAVALGVYFALYQKPEATTRRWIVENVTYGYERCLKGFDDYRLKAYKDECVIAHYFRRGPIHGCAKVRCIANFFAVSNETTPDVLSPRNLSVVREVITTDPIFCLPHAPVTSAPITTSSHFPPTEGTTRKKPARSPSYPTATSPLVCVKNVCDHTYNTKKIRPVIGWQLEGTWRDNCEEPSPCWNLESSSISGKFFEESRVKKVFDRNRCLNPETSDDCETSNLTAAVVWMQHVHCRVYNPERVGRYCKGVPLRMWECRMCPDLPDGKNRSEVLQGDLGWLCNESETYTKRSECSFDCIDQTKPVNAPKPFPVGTPCGNNSYCAFGHCFRVESLFQLRKGQLKETVQSLDECFRERNKTRSTKPVFWTKDKAETHS